MDSFWQAIAAHDWAQPEIRTEFRLYYNQDGSVLYYSMEDLPGNYIVIDRLTFDKARFDVRVKDGKIIKQNHPASWKLSPVATSNYACHKEDVSIIVAKDFENKLHWEVKTTYEAD